MIKESNRAILDECRSPPPPSPAPSRSHATWQPLHPGRLLLMLMLLLLLLLLLMLLLMLLGHLALALAFALGALDYAYFIGCKIRKTFAGQPYSRQGELAKKDFFCTHLGKNVAWKNMLRQRIESFRPCFKEASKKISRVCDLPPPIPLGHFLFVQSAMKTIIFSVLSQVHRRQ